MNWLRDIRLEKELSQVTVANHAKITQAQYCNIESGKRTPSVKTARRIAAILGFDWTRFYAEEGEEGGKK